VYNRRYDCQVQLARKVAKPIQRTKARRIVETYTSWELVVNDASIILQAGEILELYSLKLRNARSTRKDLVNGSFFHFRAFRSSFLQRRQELGTKGAFFKWIKIIMSILKILSNKF